MCGLIVVHFSDYVRSRVNSLWFCWEKSLVNFNIIACGPVKQTEELLGSASQSPSRMTAVVTRERGIAYG